MHAQKSKGTHIFTFFAVVILITATLQPAIANPAQNINSPNSEPSYLAAGTASALTALAQMRDAANHRGIGVDVEGLIDATPGPEIVFISKWGSEGNGTGEFAEPRDISVDSAGNIYVADAANNRIQKFYRNGTFITEWGGEGTGAGEFNYPSNIALSPDDFVYVADRDNHHIQKFDRNGTFITEWGSEGAANGQFKNPTGIATDIAGTVFVADTENHRIQKFNSSGGFITNWGSEGMGNGTFNLPRGIATDIAGNVFVADTKNNRIQKFNASGGFITNWGTEGAAEGQFQHPQGIAIDSSGNVYVADTGNSRIRKFDYNGTFMLGWGSEGTGDGQFKSPKGIAVDADGIVYVADTDNNRIQTFLQRDNDGDGLPNSVELVISTDPNNRDSDFDSLNDSYEVRNVSIGTDPLKADSNGDGLGDYFEVTTTNVSLDVDGDGIPNAWDSDNDGDGVVDGLDSSPFSKSTINDNFHFDIKTNGNATYIDFQIRPENPEHMKLPFQSWDWPYDDKGQIKDLDYSKDDVQITPMLELSANYVPNQSAVKDYGIVTVARKELASAPAAVSREPNKLDVFVRGLDNALYHKSWDGTQWSGWVNLGGNLTSAPAVASWGENRLDVFVRGEYYSLWHKSWDGTQWSCWDNLGGYLTSAPAVASWGENRLDVFARGDDNALRHKSWDGQWSGWDNLGGELTSAPAVASWVKNRLDVFVRGGDNALYHKAWDGHWSGWDNLGGNLTSAPAVASWGSNRLDVFARGEDNALRHKSWDGTQGTQWSGWDNLGGELTSAPAVASWGSNRLDVFARGAGNALYHKAWDGQWSGWEILGRKAYIPLTPVQDHGTTVAFNGRMFYPTSAQPLDLSADAKLVWMVNDKVDPLYSSPAAVSWGKNRIDVFVRGTDSALWHKWWDGQWHDWESLGGNLTSAPAVASWGENRLDVFARGEDNALRHKAWDGTQWSGWESLGGNLTSAPAVASWGLNRIDVFVRGGDNALYHKAWDGQWSGWDNLGGELTSAPAVASWEKNRLDVFVRGGDNALYHKAWDGHWSGWDNLGGVLTSAPAAVSREKNRIDVFVRGGDNALYHKAWDGQWSGWDNLHGVLTSAPAVASWGSNRLDVFVRGTENTLCYKSYESGWYGWGGLDVPPADLESEVTTIARYKEDFMLTGFSVEENYGADAGLFYSGDRNQTMNAYMVLKYEFLRSQNSLLEAPEKLEEHNVSVTSNISSYSHHDVALIAVLNKTKDALDRLPDGKILPIVFALSDVSANSAMGTSYIQGNEYDVDLTNKSVVTTKSIKMSWYNTTTDEIIGFDELIGDVKIWEGDDIEKKANMLMLLLIASFGETTLPEVDDHEIEFEDPEENEVLEWIHKGYSVFEHLAGPLIEKGIEKGIFSRAKGRILEQLYTSEYEIEKGYEEAWPELDQTIDAVNEVKNIEQLKGVMGEGAVLEEAGWASKLGKVAEVIEVVGWVLVDVVAIYTFIAVAKAEGWSAFGFALGAAYALMQLLFFDILMAIGCIPYVGWIIVLLIVIADIIASHFGYGSGWLMKKLIDLLFKFKLRTNLDLEQGETTLNIEDYDDNGLTVGDKLTIRSWFWAKASETKRGIEHGNYNDYTDSYIYPEYEYHKDTSTFESGSTQRYCGYKDYYYYRYKEKCYTGLWLMPKRSMRNLPLTSGLSADYKFYYDECCVTCSSRSKTDSIPADYDTTYFDVLPGNITDFVNWYATPLQDTDGDGLLNSVEGHQDTYYKICAEHSGKCLDVSSGSTAEGANVEQWAYEGIDNQKWSLEEVGDGYYKICAKHSGKCLSIEDGGSYNGANVVQKTYGGYTDQNWRLDHVGEGNYKIINNRSSKCLNVSDNSTLNGANVWQWGYIGKENQKWILEPVECDTSANKWDTDSDGLSDMFEVHTFGYDISPTKADTDSDGLTDMLELELGTDPTENDTDSDGLTDFEEHRGWNITFNYLGDPGKEFSETVWSDPRINDTDFDGLTDYEEYIMLLNPRSEDTNGDGISDNDGNPTSWSSVIKSPDGKDIGGVDDGGGAAIADINGNGKPDLLLMCVVDDAGANHFRYLIGWDIDTDGNTSSWSSVIKSPAIGNDNDGGGAAIADINGNGVPDLLLMAVDDPYGANKFWYMIGWDIDTDGNTSSWSSVIKSPAIGNDNDGGGAAIADINGNGVPDLLLMAVDDPAGANKFWYMIGWDIDTDGNTSSWSSVIKSPAIGNKNAGGGATIADINGNGVPDLLLMAVDDPAGANKFEYLIGWDIDTHGNPGSWSSVKGSPAIGNKTVGGGSAIADINGNGKQDLLLMAIDAPAGANHFWYMIGWDIKTGESETTSSGGTPVGASLKVESATQDTDNDGLTDETETTGWDITFTNSTGTYTHHVTSEPLLKDTDFDGLNDHEEFNASSNPRNVDTDGDGLSDYVEKELGTAVTNYDIDGDGLDDGTEITLGSDPEQSDTDGDGLSDFEEFVLGSDPNNSDTDSDELTDSQEKQFNSSLCNPDSDEDLLFDAQEYNLSTDPWNPDSDSDNLTDGYEIIFYNTSALNNDTDADGILDGYEIELWTDPLCNDTDGDYISDLRELELGTDPLWNDTDDDGVTDLEDTDSYVPHVARVILAYDPDEDTYEFVDKLTQYTNVTIVSPDELMLNYSDAPYIVLVGRPDGDGTAGNITRDILIKSGDNSTLTAMLGSDYSRFAVEYGVWTPTQTVVMLTQPYHSDHYRVLSTLKGMKVTRLPDSVEVEYPSPREFFSIEARKEIGSSVWVELEEAATPTVKMSRHDVSTTPFTLSHTVGLASEEETAGRYLEINVSENVQNETRDIINWAWVGMYYTVSDLDRTGDGDADDAGDLNESTLSLYLFDKSGWTKLSEETGVDTTNVVLYGKEYEGYVWANVSHLGLYGLAGQIGPPHTTPRRHGGDHKGTYPPGWFETPTPVETPTSAPAETPAITPTEEPTATAPTAPPTETPTTKPPTRGIPGFEVGFIFFALLAAAYLALRRNH